MIGVEMVDSSRSTKAAKNRIDKGVAGRSMMAVERGCLRQRAGSPTDSQESRGGGEAARCAARACVGVASFVSPRCDGCRRLLGALPENERMWMGAGARRLLWH
jgi:hypothetical protein